jgi:hypothetical protein
MNLEELKEFGKDKYLESSEYLIPYFLGQLHMIKILDLERCDKDGCRLYKGHDNYHFKFVNEGYARWLDDWYEPIFRSDEDLSIIEIFGKPDLSKYERIDIDIEPFDPDEIKIVSKTNLKKIDYKKTKTDGDDIV